MPDLKVSAPHKSVPALFDDLRHGAKLPCRKWIMALIPTILMDSTQSQAAAIVKP